jgi:hypothetical protein
MKNNNATRSDCSHSSVHIHALREETPIHTYSKILLKLLVYCIAIVPWILVFHSSSDEHITYDNPSDL